MPDTIPRPRLHAVHEWTCSGYAYRAELYDHIRHRTFSDGALLASAPDLPDSWWTSLRKALDDLADVDTERVAIRPDRSTWRLQTFFGAQIDTRAPAWSTAHADIQWSNLTGPDLCVLDWERWGRAPAGYDAATLYISSLTMPDIAARVRRELGHVLETPAGRFSELVVASEFLQGMQRGNNLGLEAPLRRRITQLFG